ncbi:AfsR/SARP family transcriptional regulator [Solihabitans fulvus]|uniref:AfsR/SARP family transcriptional regulator n=1 Tax=Solihabitans fulvus TaxID=1892852 RepID=UPI001661C50F|nr:AfsR/SARP family transcriptional regulator [Solihabitans fulvus]
MSPIAQIGLLGPVEVGHGQHLLPIGPPMQRAVVALLAVDAGRCVPVDRLIEGLWAERPPAGARGLIQTYVSRLRAALRPVDTTILRRAGGYLLDLPADLVDLHAFRRLVAEGRAAGDHRAIRAGLRLWRHTPLAGLAPTPLVELIRAGLAEERLAATEEAIDLELRAGRHREVLGELTGLAREHPLREQVLAQLLLALHRCGRQAEALRVYDAARRRRADELGLDPTPPLVELHARILRNDSAAVDGLGEATTATATRHTPRQLPYDLPDFTGRVAQLATLTALSKGTARTMVIAVINGMPGVGKTALAVHLAHALTQRFPDGQLFVDLRGRARDRPPATSAAVLATLLRSVGVPAERIPDDPDERSALWRTELAGRRALIVLDDAVDSAQVRPLIPGTPGAMVLVTSRDTLVGLDGAVSLSLGTLTADEARALFVGMVGDRAMAEPEAVAEVVRLCIHLPLGIRFAAARLRARPHATVAMLADRLRACGVRKAAAARWHPEQGLEPHWAPAPREAVDDVGTPVEEVFADLIDFADLVD